MQLVLQHFCKTDWKAIAFYHPRSNLSYNKQGFQVGKTHNIAIQLVFAAKSQNKLLVLPYLKMLKLQQR